jgi:hypothetical protein
LLVKEDYLDSCIYGEDGDKELNLDINGDDDEKINHCFLGFQSSRIAECDG